MLSLDSAREFNASSAALAPVVRYSQAMLSNTQTELFTMSAARGSQVQCICRRAS